MLYPRLTTERAGGAFQAIAAHQVEDRVTRDEALKIAEELGGSADLLN